MKGQLSAEMLILVAVIIAVVAIAATQLIGSAKKSSTQAAQQADAVLARTENAMKAPVGEFCSQDKDCKSNDCECPSDCTSTGKSYSCQ
jgi:uncharacterized protein (UPF0333 family)